MEQTTQTANETVDLKFSELDLTPKVMKAIEEMGFETATSIQSQAIPLIRTGVDVIGRSQTGTGKTVAFAIPAIEKINTHEERSTTQVLILCPTRELAQQACEEVKKLAKFKAGIRPVEIYGGTPMDRQIIRLKKANIVIGTPGRVMDHMRRRTLKLENLKMIILDEADEMLSMGFKEDIETILKDTPEDRQTILFSATMPQSILSLTKQFQKTPKMIEIDKKNVTLNNIEQFYVDAPMGRKMDALNLIIRYYNPGLAIIFCNTKHMVDEIAEYLVKCGFNTEGLHGDMKQSQRTKVMDSFKYGKTQILVATDVAARGIDVNDIEYVINYDIPQNTEYYIHRIGRTGRAGKAGKAITMCSGRRQVYTMRDIGRQVKSDIQMLDIPSLKDIQKRSVESNTVLMENTLKEEISGVYEQMVKELVIKGFSLEDIAAAALQLNFGKSEKEIVEVKSVNSGVKFDGGNVSHRKMEIDIGRDSRVAPNHIVGAITEQTGINGSDIGKIEIFDNKTVVGIPAARIEEVAQAMQGCKICGRPTNTSILEDKPFNGSRSGGGYRKSSNGGGRGGFGGGYRGGSRSGSSNKSGGYRGKKEY